MRHLSKEVLRAQCEEEKGGGLQGLEGNNVYKNTSVYFSQIFM